MTRHPPRPTAAHRDALGECMSALKAIRKHGEFYDMGVPTSLGKWLPRIDEAINTADLAAPDWPWIEP